MTDESKSQKKNFTHVKKTSMLLFNIYDCTNYSNYYYLEEILVKLENGNKITNKNRKFLIHSIKRALNSERNPFSIKKPRNGKLSKQEKVALDYLTLYELEDESQNNASLIIAEKYNLEPDTVLTYRQRSKDKVLSLLGKRKYLKDNNYPEYEKILQKIRPK